MSGSKLPHKNTLSICLTESVVFLRSADFTGRRQDEDTQSSMLRGLLTLTLVKPTRISSIEIDLIGRTRVSWPEGIGARRTEVLEEHKIFSATQTFFKGATTPSSPHARRTLSVGPGLLYYQDEHGSDLPPAFHEDEDDHSLPRGRGRARRRLSADHSLYQRAPIEHRENSRSPTPIGSPERRPSLTPLYHPIATDVHTPPSSRSSINQISPLTLMHPHEIEVVPHDGRSLSRAPSHSTESQYTDTTRYTGTTQYTDTTRGPPSLSRAMQRTSSASSVRIPGELSRPPSADRTPHSAYPSPVREREREPSSDDPHGRRGWRSSLASVSTVLDSLKEHVRSNSRPAADLREPSRGRAREKADEPESAHAPHLLGLHKDKSTLERVGEVLGMEEEHKEFGDGWREFKKGTYTFPISFAIPSNVPPTLDCDYGSVQWRLKSYVHRPGTFTPKLAADHDVILVSAPCEDDTEDTENIVVERLWDDQLHYRLAVAGRMFPIGGEIPVYFSFLPMAKMKIHRVSVILEEKVDYWIQHRKITRSDFTSRFPLLVLKSSVTNDKNAPPILPLDSDDPFAFTRSPLHALLGPEDDASEMAAGFMGTGPWVFHATLKLPESCGLVHFTNKNKKSSIAITHMLKIIVRVERGDDVHVDPKTGKRKLFDIVVQTPVHILSCLCNSQYLNLPRYSASSANETTPALSPCACPIKRRGQTPVRNALPPAALALERTTSIDSTHSTHEASSSNPLYTQNLVFERLITGQQSEEGEAPPPYEAVSHSPVRAPPVR